MADKQNQKPNIHAKHRERVSEKFLKVGLDAFSEHEIIEFLLFYVFAQQDTNDLAHRLIDTFGSVRGVLSASVEELCTVKGIGQRAAVLLKLVGDLIVRDREKKDERPILDTVGKISDYLLRIYSVHNNTEMVIALAFDSSMRLIRVIKVADGSLDTVSISVSKLARSLVTCGAAGVVLAHNHPSNNAIPSSTDIKTTKSLKRAVEAVGIELIDHIICVTNDYTSMLSSGNRILFTID